MSSKSLHHRLQDTVSQAGRQSNSVSVFKLHISIIDQYQTAVDFWSICLTYDSKPHDDLVTLKMQKMRKMVAVQMKNNVFDGSISPMLLIDDRNSGAGRTFQKHVTKLANDSLKISCSDLHLSL